MFSTSRGIFARHRTSFLSGAVTLIIICFSFGICDAQSVGATTSGTFGNEIIEGRVFFPTEQKSVMRPVVKLQSDSSSELTTVTDADGNFRFTHLRPDSYVIIVKGGDEYDDAHETVTVGTAGPVPGEGNPFDYAMPTVYQIQVHLKPKRANTFDAGHGSTPVPANVPQAARNLFKQAIESAHAGQNAKAIERFKAAISQAPTFALAYNELGVLYLKRGEADKAAEAFAQAIKLGRDDFVAHLNYGIALLNLKKFTEAEQQLREALQKNATAPTGHYYLALVLMNRQDFGAAEGEFKTSISDSNDGIAPAHKYLGGIYWRQKQYALAADELEKYVTQDPKAPDASKIRETIKDLRSKK